MYIFIDIILNINIYYDYHSSNCFHLNCLIKKVFRFLQSPSTTTTTTYTKTTISSLQTTNKV